MAGWDILDWSMLMIFVIGLISFDLGYSSKCPKGLSWTDSFKLSIGYLLAAILLGIWIAYHHSTEHSMLYFTAYVLEKSLALDNLFIIAMLFSHFNIPQSYQHRVLLYGILGVIILRAIFIGFGIVLIQQFDFILLFLAVFLIWSGIKLWNTQTQHPTPFFLEKIKKYIPVTDQLEGHNFFIKIDGHWYATRLFVALVAIELTDVMFALDSIPAVLAITSDPFLVYSSNLMAIMGLRSLYFVIIHGLHRLYYLKRSLAALLILMSGKIVYSHFYEKLPASISLSLTLGCLSIGVIASYLHTYREQQ